MTEPVNSTTKAKAENDAHRWQLITICNEDLDILGQRVPKWEFELPTAPNPQNE